ncbi:putative reverse transcriptase from transposon X-element protein, partial [Rhizoctonia solani 123E]
SNSVNCIDFAPSATSKRLDRPPLTIRGEVITPVKSHTLLGVTLDQTLTWREQCDKALAKGMSWAGQLNRLARMSYGTPMRTARRLYLSIAVPRFSYAADIWYSPVTQGPGGRRSGSAGFADRLARIQSTAARAILGAMRSTPVTSLDAHLDLLPMHILMNEACQRAAVRLAATPTDHPLRKAVIKCATGRKRHQPPLQRILHFAGVNPSDFEQWPSYRKPLPSAPPERFQDRHGAAATAWADKAHLLVFSDAAVSRAGIAAAAILWGDGDRELRTGVRLGEPGSFSSLDAEVAGILLAAHLVTTIQQDTIVDDVTIYSDSQAAISCVNHHATGASHNLLRETRKAIRTARKGSGGTLVNLVWSPGHMGIPGNEAADAEASRVASGHSHPPHLIPQFLVDFHPATNPTTIIQSMKAKNRSLAKTHWNLSVAGGKYASKYPNLFPQHFIAHTRDLTRSRSTLLFRLTTGHVQLRQHLHRLQLVDSPQCELCGLEPETVPHYLFRCPHFAEQRHTHLSSRGPDFLRL